MRRDWREKDSGFVYHLLTRLLHHPLASPTPPHSKLFGRCHEAAGKLRKAKQLLSATGAEVDQLDLGLDWDKEGSDGEGAEGGRGEAQGSGGRGGAGDG